MLILVGVTINFALNGGIITKAKTAAKQTQIAADREALLSCVIASIGIDGKVNFEELDLEILKIGFTGSNGTYVSPEGNSFIVNEDGNIVSEGQSSGSSGSSSTSGSSSSSSSSADLEYLENLIGSNIGDVCDPSGGTFNDPNIMMDYAAIIEMGGSMESSNGYIYYPIMYNGKAFFLLIDENDIITSVTENTTNNSNSDLTYLRSYIGKTVDYATTRNPNTNELEFNDSNITYASAYTGSPISTGESMYMIYVSYNGNDYTIGLMSPDGATSFEDYIVFVIIEGIYANEP